MSLIKTINYMMYSEQTVSPVKRLKCNELAAKWKLYMASPKHRNQTVQGGE